MDHSTCIHSSLLLLTLPSSYVFNSYVFNSCPKSLFTTQSPQLTPQSEFTSHSSKSIVVMAEDTSHNQSSQFTVCSLVIVFGSHLVVE